MVLLNYKPNLKELCEKQSCFSACVDCKDYYPVEHNLHSDTFQQWRPHHDYMPLAKMANYFFFF